MSGNEASRTTSGSEWRKSEVVSGRKPPESGVDRHPHINNAYITIIRNMDIAGIRKQEDGLPCFIVETGREGNTDFIVFRGGYETRHDYNWLVDAEQIDMWFNGSVWQDGIPKQMWVSRKPVPISEAEYSSLVREIQKGTRMLSVFNATCDALSKRYGRNVVKPDEFPSDEGCFVYLRRDVLPYLVGWGLFRGRITVADAKGMRWDAEAEQFAVPVHPEGEGGVFKFLRLPVKVPEAIWDRLYSEAERLISDREDFMERCRKLVEGKKSRF